MADIVERLRLYAQQFEDQHAPDHITQALRAGADEIERKKAEISSLLNTLADARTENMKLRAALERIADTDPDDGTAWFHSVARAALDYRKMEGLVMSDNLVERVARAMSRIDWCGAKIDDEFCLCDDPRLPDEVRAGECFCRMKAPAAIAGALEEAAAMVERVFDKHVVAAAIRALIPK